MDRLFQVYHKHLVDLILFIIKEKKEIKFFVVFCYFIVLVENKSLQAPYLYVYIDLYLSQI
jgi:hypothetical protein